MDLHVYRNSQDRWYDLRAAARERGAVLAVNAVTVDELVERLTPDVRSAPKKFGTFGESNVPNPSATLPADGLGAG